MSALREWAAALGPEAHGAVAVSWLGKAKTAAQMVSLAALLFARCCVSTGGCDSYAAAAGSAGVVLLGSAALLAVWSLGEYLAGLWRFMV
jgi:phosphatidylglycerophosphate synthase